MSILQYFMTKNYQTSMQKYYGCRDVSENNFRIQPVFLRNVLSFQNEPGADHMTVSH